MLYCFVHNGRRWKSPTRQSTALLSPNGYRGKRASETSWATESKAHGDRGKGAVLVLVRKERNARATEGEAHRDRGRGALEH